MYHQQGMIRSKRWVLFWLFFLSGFAGLVYQVVWTRMAFAAFGIIAPVLSVVISVFMLGLAVGSWAGGRAIGPLVRRTGLPAAAFYAGAELLVACGAFAVPAAFTAGSRLLLGSGQVDSAEYLARSAVVLAAALLPWCICMGLTFPFMLAHARGRGTDVGAPGTDATSQSVFKITAQPGESR
jgi:spermidine synthase